jgi:hypothetical protein
MPYGTNNDEQDWQDNYILEGITTVGTMQVHICNEPDAGRDNDNQRCGGFVVNFSERLCKVLIFFMVRR